MGQVKFRQPLKHLKLYGLLLLILEYLDPNMGAYHANIHIEAQWKRVFLIS